MKALHVNFAPQSAARLIAAMSPAHWLLAGLGVTMMLLGAMGMHNLAQQQTLVEAARVQAQDSARHAHPIDTAKSAISDEQASAVNSAIEQINLPWGSLLTAIEHATPASVAVLELAPDAKKHLLRGTAETDAPDKMLAYISRLKAEPLFGKVFLTRHEVNADSPVRAVRFEFEAEWREAAQ